MGIIPEIISQHAEESAFLWRLRDRAVDEPHYRLKQLTALDERVEAHLDGLRIAGDAGWDLLVDELKWEAPGEIFAAAAIALEGGVEARIQRALSAALPDRALRRAFASALGWSSTRVADPFVRRLLADAAGPARHIGIMAAAARGMNLAELLAALGQDGDSLVRARALRAMGQLGRADLGAMLVQQSGDADEACRFWALWSHGVLAATHDVVTYLIGFAESGGAFAGHATQLIFRILAPSDSARVWNAWARRAVLMRLAVTAAGVSGDPDSVPWILEQMGDPKLARVAGEAFSMITGADLAHLDLDQRPPQDLEGGPTEDAADPAVGLDPDENLPFPVGAKCRRWWDAHRGDFKSGVRHLCGLPVRTANLQTVLRDGFQRQRQAAALELSLRNPGRPVFECRARGFRQGSALS